jgi:hypothetical protein
MVPLFQQKTIKNCVIQGQIRKLIIPGPKNNNIYNKSNIFIYIK